MRKQKHFPHDDWGQSGDEITRCVYVYVYVYHVPRARGLRDDVWEQDYFWGTVHVLEV